MSKIRSAIVGILAAAGLIALTGAAVADRGGWDDPPGGWDIVMEGHGLAGYGWINASSSSDPGLDRDPRTWNDNWDADDVTTFTVTGAGDTEDGITTAADAIVLQLQDNYTLSDNGHGRGLKFCYPFAGTYDTNPTDYKRNPERNVVNVNNGVTVVVRFCVMPGTLFEPDSVYGERCYTHDLVGGDASDGDDDRFGLAVGNDVARFCAGNDTLSTNIEVGDLTAHFRTFWIVFEPQPGGSLDNWMGTLYVDGSTVPLASYAGPGDMGFAGVWSDPPGRHQNAFENWFKGGDQIDTSF